MSPELIESELFGQAQGGGGAGLELHLGRGVAAGAHGGAVEIDGERAAAGAEHGDDDAAAERTRPLGDVPQCLAELIAEGHRCPRFYHGGI